MYLDFTKLETNPWKEPGVTSGSSYWRADPPQESGGFVKPLLHLSGCGKFGTLDKNTFVCHVTKIFF